MRFLKVDMKRALTEPAFFYSILAGIVIGGISLAAAALRNPEPYGAGELFRYAQPMLLPFAAPLLAAVPYSNMNLLEEETGYALFLSEKLGKGGYEFRRFLTVGVSGGVCTAVPVLILWFGCAAAEIFLGTGMAGDFAGTGLAAGLSASGEVFGPAGLFHILALDFCFGFSCAVLAYGLTFISRKRYLPVVCPEVFYLLFTYAFPYLGLDAYYPPLGYTPWASAGGTEGKVWEMFTLMILCGLLLTAFGKGKRSFRMRGRRADFG